MFIIAFLASIAIFQVTAFAQYAIPAFQSCTVQNRILREAFGDYREKITFSCDSTTKLCRMDFFLNGQENFYCHMRNCEFDIESGTTTNRTNSVCQNISCSCIKYTLMCNPDWFDISEMLEYIKGPGHLNCQQPNSGGDGYSCELTEPVLMDTLASIFGNINSIEMSCKPGLIKSQESAQQSEPKSILNHFHTVSVSKGLLWVMGICIFVIALNYKKQKQQPVIPMHVEPTKSVS